jgi:predicted AAA+ superfamily ATPase
MLIPRFYQDLNEYIKPNKALIIYGPRRVGKTTLVRQYLKTIKEKVRIETGDNIVTQQILSSQNLTLLKQYAKNYSLLFIDEAQRIPSLGLNLKIMVDQIPEIKIIITGSSSLELAGQVGEPLVGRKTTLQLYPVAQLELANMYNHYDLHTQLPNHLVFGGYPEVVTEEDLRMKQEILKDITESYLLKDILELEKVKYSKLLLDLLRLLAYQIGGEVSLSELAGKLQIDVKTVGRYLDLFEKSFIIYNVRGFSRNLRKEITKKSKYYFFDNGIRNAVINNFNPLETRNDVGMLWENFLFIERMKKRSYQRIYANDYFWRTWDKEEIDLIEEREGRLFGFEFKYNTSKMKPLKTWKANYPDSDLSLINKDNYFDFIL